MTTPREILSVGIDIGTTTTQIVFSKLTMADKARAGQIPRVDILNREVLYQSPVVFTPLRDSDTIDPQQVSQIVRGEYQLAGIHPDQVESGAVIITGETAKKKNADEILKVVADLAGDFVVTVAGPRVESMIAGRGSGAAAYSRQRFTTLTNVDVGGGSSNSAIFRQGEMQASAAMNIGGRILTIDSSSGMVRGISQPAKWILEHLRMHLEIGDVPSLPELKRVTDCMADLIVELIEGDSSPLAQKVYLTDPSPLSGRGKTLMFSGGVGYYYYHPLELKSVPDGFVHGDIGPLFAKSLRENPALQHYNVQEPPATLRATVLGASSQLVTLSGSTIWAEADILPLKNIPVIHLALTGYDLRSGVIHESIQAATKRWDVDGSCDHFAITFDLQGEIDYPSLLEVANGLVAFACTLPPEHPLVVVIKRDYAQVLGQTIKSILPNLPLLVIDHVGLEEGDFIDIGAPLMDGRVVPLMVKTLVFYH